jgi:uncharacterized phiE125 gp8 family phage protein
MFTKEIFQIISISNINICSLDEIKNYMRIIGDHDDKLIENLIDSATHVCENFTKLSLFDREIKFTTYLAGKKSFDLKYAPLTKILKVHLKNENNEIILSENDYIIDYDIPSIILKESFYNVKLEIKYIVGFDKNIPTSIKHGIMMHVEEMYDRDLVHSTSLSFGIRNLYMPYRRLAL